MTKPTFEERISALESFCFGEHFTAGHARPIDSAGLRVIDRIIASVCNHPLVALPLAALKVKSRVAKVVFARHVAMYLAVELSGLSLQVIATAFNRGNHGTILHAHRKIQAEIKRCCSTRSFVGHIHKELQIELQRGA